MVILQLASCEFFVSFVAHDLNYLQELEILAFRSAFDREDNRSSSQVVFGHCVLALAQAVQRGLLLSDSQVHINLC